jgi:CxxC motif-containing protein
MNNNIFTCHRCPKKCEISIKLDGYNLIKSFSVIKGNVCKLGMGYVIHDINDPNRVITTTVKVKNGISQIVPVLATNEIPENKIFDLMSILSGIELEAPVMINTLVLKNVFQTGVDIITKGSVQRKKEKINL